MKNYARSLLAIYLFVLSQYAWAKSTDVCDLDGEQYQFTYETEVLPDELRRVRIPSCLLLTVDGSIADIKNLDFLPECLTPLPTGSLSGAGGCFLKFSLKMAKVLGAKWATVVDTSGINCPSGEFISLGIAMILARGHTWYEGYEFIPLHDDEKIYYASLKERIAAIPIEELRRLFPLVDFSAFSSRQDALSNHWKTDCRSFSKGVKQIKPLYPIPGEWIRKL